MQVRDRSHTDHFGSGSHFQPVRSLFATILSKRENIYCVNEGMSGLFKQTQSNSLHSQTRITLPKPRSRETLSLVSCKWIGLEHFSGSTYRIGLRVGGTRRRVLEVVGETFLHPHVVPPGESHQIANPLKSDGPSQMRLSGLSENVWRYSINPQTRRSIVRFHDSQRGRNVISRWSS